MKLNRLLEMITILLNRRSVTAAELARWFGVSTRTIYRDVDALSAAGIPVMCAQGTGGGISIMEHYALSRATLTDQEKANVLFALKAMQPTRHPEVDGVLSKLGALFQGPECDWIEVDLSPWGSDPDAHHRFSDIREAILGGKVISIQYIDSQNRPTLREVEPLMVAFKSSAWYLMAYCRLRHSPRTFRVSRIKSISFTGELFNREATLKKASSAQSQEALRAPLVPLVLRFSERALSRLYDDYNADQLEDNGDGSYTLVLDLPEDEWLYGYILSFGEYVTVISPPHIRDIILEKSHRIFSKYAK